MRLEVNDFPVKDVVFSDETKYEAGTLCVSKPDLIAAMKPGAIITDIKIDVAYPGESTRIVNVLDTIEPRCKADGKSGVFPGFLSSAETVGRGITNVLKGLAMMECAEYPLEQGGLLIAREAIVEMTGDASELTPFGKTINLVLQFTLEQGKEDTEYDAAIREATLKGSEYLARTTIGLPPEYTRVYDISSPAQDSDLPRILYINQIHSQGPNATTFVYGRSFTDNLPTIIYPTEMIDGALVSANYVWAAYKTSTYMHCNNPIVEELCRGHGKDHIMLPVVISRGHHYSFNEKMRSGQFAAKVASALQPDGIIVTQEGGGNSIIDCMQTIKACEQLGIPTATIQYEMSASDKVGISLLDSVPEANAIVSSGSPEQGIRLPKVDKVLGGNRLRIGLEELSPIGPLDLGALYQMYSSANQIGFGKSTCKAY